MVAALGVQCGPRWMTCTHIGQSLLILAGETLDTYIVEKENTLSF